MTCNRCRGCVKLFYTEIPALYCSPECKESEHRKLAPKRSQPKTARTLSLRGAYEALADESARFNAYHGTMRRS